MAVKGNDERHVHIQQVGWSLTVVLDADRYVWDLVARFSDWVEYQTRRRHVGQIHAGAFNDLVSIQCCVQGAPLGFSMVSLRSPDQYQSPRQHRNSYSREPCTKLDNRPHQSTGASFLPYSPCRRCGFCRLVSVLGVWIVMETLPVPV